MTRSTKENSVKGGERARPGGLSTEELVISSENDSRPGVPPPPCPGSVAGAAKAKVTEIGEDAARTSPLGSKGRGVLDDDALRSSMELAGLGYAGKVTVGISDARDGRRGTAQTGGVGKILPASRRSGPETGAAPSPDLCRSGVLLLGDRPLKGQAVGAKPVLEKLPPTSPGLAAAGGVMRTHGRDARGGFSALESAHPEVVSAPGPNAEHSRTTLFSTGREAPWNGATSHRNSTGDRGQEGTQPRSVSHPGAVTVGGPMMGEEGEASNGDSQAVGQSRSSSGPRIILSAELADEGEDPRQGGPSNMPGRLAHNPEEPVYDGVAMLRQSWKQSTQGLWSTKTRRRTCVFGVVALCCAVAIVVPLAMKRGRATSPVVEAITVQPSYDSAMRPTAFLSPTAVPTMSLPPSNSLEPSRPPTSERFEYIKATLLNASEEASIHRAAESLGNSESPQSRAMMWLVDEDERQVNARDKEAIVQRFALATLVFATGGEEVWWDTVVTCSTYSSCDSRKEKGNVLSSAHECDWKINVMKLYSRWWSNNTIARVTCEGGNETVTSVFADESGLNGTIPEELGLLTGLRVLELTRNNNDFSGGLHGTLPRTLGNLASLDRLVLSNNELRGTIPSTIDWLTSLTEISMEGNRLNGTIPAGMNNLGKLEVINLHENSFSGPLLFTSDSLPNLRELVLHSNELTGTLPRELSTYLNLKWLWLGGNSMTGTLPTEVGALVNLEGLDLGGNNLEGAIPDEIGDMSMLQYLHLGKNRFVGTLPSSMVALTDLYMLDLHQNRLSGSLPTFLGNLTGLFYLVLSRNKFTLTIPDIIGDIEFLHWLFLDANQLDGSLPQSLVKLEFLEYFSIANTSLTGNITFFCDNPRGRVLSLTLADCHGSHNEVMCDCCTVCCSDYDRSSNLTTSDLGWLFEDLFGEGRLPGCFQNPLSPLL